MSNPLFIQRCNQLALQAEGYVAPNPLVGCVIVSSNKIIAEGYHQKFGQPHAEVNAINAVVDKSILSNSTLYVNLEPCSHFGKTPPCVDLIIRQRIPHVVIGCMDPTEKVNGKGIEKLKAAGIKVETGVLENECRELNKRFFCFHEKKRPFIILKWAQSADGFIGKQNAEQPIKISNEYSHTLSHKWRSEEAAIMVGTNTVLLDNPQLNVRHWKGIHPVRVLLDRNLKIKSTAKIFSTDQKTIIYNSEKTAIDQNKIFVTIDFNNNVIKQVLDDLFSKNILSVLVEGGATLLESFINTNLWDEARVFTSAKNLGSGVKAPSLPHIVSSSEKIMNDVLELFYNKEK